MTERHHQLTVQAPGRINLIGEHTDYNDGFVLPAAIDKKMTVRMQRNGRSSECRITAGDLGEAFTFNLQDFSPLQGGWPNYVLGVVHELQKLGGKIEGFDAEFGGNIPLGGGMSSSAALECSFAVALNELFGLGFEPWQLIRASQMAEHHFVGTKCGIMDQFASMMGRKDEVMLLDCRSLEFRYFPLNLDRYQLLLLNTNVSHSLASSEYNTRREECEEGVSILKQTYPEITNLRDVSLQQLSAQEGNLPEHIFRRCHHVISENERVIQATRALADQNFKKLGELIYQSHFSLQHDYEVSCPELDFLVQQTLEKDYVLGSRMMGGGFGGCTLNLVARNQVEQLIDRLSQAYRDRFAIDLTPIAVSIGNGAGTVE